MFTVDRITFAPHLTVMIDHPFSSYGDIECDSLGHLRHIM